jgi:tetratricopeptide (TPR) repeat protein
MTPVIARFLKGAVIVAVVAAVVAAVALPAAYRARRARWTAELGAAARQRLADGETEEAARLFGLYLKEAPDDAAAHAQYATLVRDLAMVPGVGRRQQEAALEAISTAVRKNPESLPLRRMLALKLLELRQFGTARQEISILRELAAASPSERLADDDIDSDEITLLAARACLGDDNVSEAAELVAGLTGFDPAGKSFDDAWKPGRFVTEASLLLASILAEKREDAQSAQRVIEKLKQTAPKDHRAWLAQSRWHAAHGEPRLAAEEIDRAAALAPDDYDVLATSFAMALSDRRFDEASLLAGRIHELFPRLPDGGLALAEVAVRRGEPEQAVEPLQQSLERLPAHPALLLSLANVQLLAKRFDDAEQTIRSLLERSGSPNPLIGMLEARLLVARQQWLAAVKKLDALRPLVSDSAATKRQVDLLLAECHARLGQADEQLAASQRVLSRDTGSRTARVSTAAALAATGKPEKALAEYEAVAKELGDDELLRQPLVWQPLLRLRGVHQLRLPAKDRDWSLVTQLLDALERAQAAPAAQLAMMRYDHLVSAGDSAAAAKLLAQAIEAHGDDPQLWERMVLATLRQQGFDAAMQQWKRIPAAVADDPQLLVLQARLATRAPADEARAILDGVEAKAASLPVEQSRRLLAAIASIRLGGGDQVGAERVWQAILAASPDDLPTHFALFELACEQHDLTKAGREADEISRICGPDSANSRAVAAATLLLQVAVGRSPAFASPDGRPVQIAQPGGKPGAEDVAKLDAARNLLVEAESERPGWPLLQRLFADLELLRGDVPAAIGRLEKAVELNPENLALLRALVSLLSGSNRQQQARTVLRRIINATGDNVASEDLRIWARRTMAELAARDGTFADVQEAVAGLARHEDRDGKPAVEDMVLSIGVLSGRPEPEAWREAIALLAALSDRRPLNTRERMQRAELLDRTGHWSDCREDMLALAAEPDPQPAVLAAIVEKLIRHGDVEQAAAHLKILADREPKAAGMLALQARLAIARDDRAAAVAAARQIAAADTASAKGLQQLQAAAVLMEELDLDDEAEAVLGQLAERSVAGMVAQAEFLARRGRTSDAIDLLQANRQRLGPTMLLQAAVAVLRTVDANESQEQAQRVDQWFATTPRSERESERLALLQAEWHAVRGRHEEAAASYRDLLSRSTLPPVQRSIVQNNLAMQLARPETAAEAKRLMDEVIAEQGPHPSLLDTLGLALLAGGAVDEAVDVLSEASLDRSVEKRLHLACALVAAGKLEDAQQVIRDAYKSGLTPRRLDADDRKRLRDVEAAIGSAG